MSASQLLGARTAKCTCGRTAPSSQDLAFFEFCGGGSKQAKDSCKHCGYYERAHDKEAVARISTKPETVIERGLCKGFEPHGEYEFDRYYCGCMGWD